ncbi:NAD(P)-dependent oxidoreductase [Paracoccus sp. (in: a-proteobacteria)]|uniref:NAD(P)-dependent oxidoreductase n=1 Tax=Paracoccus sp. TaxID=267 RepID=UPI002B0025C7|nr:NAD(P)-dependent oxidoreductase [Paracoccus sp. (in: a-proteobacteria)]
MIGYIGLGNMGGAIARALAARHDVAVFDLSPAAMAACAQAGGQPCADLGQLGRACSVIFLCMPGIEQVRSVLNPDGPLLRAAAPGTIFVDQSTSDPVAFRTMAHELAALGFSLVDAPVSGGPQGVAERSLLVTLGGEASTVDRIAAILESVTPHLLRTGPVGSAMMIKLANNYIAAMQAAVSLQALAMAVGFGCDPHRTAEAFRRGSARNFYSDRYLHSHVLTGALESGAAIDVMQKDVRLAIKTARTEGRPLLGADELLAMIDRCTEDYGRDAPYNAIALTVSDQSGVALGNTRGRSLGPAT